MSATRLRVTVLAALGLAVACAAPDDGPLMEPGNDCMHCHTAKNSPEPDAPVWKVAGTLYPAPGAVAEDGLAGADVIIIDANQKQVTLRTTLAGNFYSAEDFQFPISVEIRKNGKSAKMKDSPPVGTCNACHAAEPKNNAPGRIYLPQ
jgi:hypothetical protein